MENDVKTQLKAPDLQSENVQLRQQNASLQEQLVKKEALIEYYLEQLRLLRKKQFGVSSEKNTAMPEQLSLFNESEALADAKKAEPTVEEITYTRRKQKATKEENLEDLVTETVEHDLSGEDLQCPQCGEAMQEVKVEERYEIKIIPAQVEVVKHRQHVYACGNCEANDIRTPFAKGKGYDPFLPKSSASAETVAWLLDQKYNLGLPLYRLEQEVSQQMGLDLSRQTMSNWLLKAVEHYVEPMNTEMRRHLLMQQHLHADETRVQVLNEPGRSAEQKSYMWVYRTGRDSPSIVLYDYQTTRASKHPVKFLEGFSGTLQVDGYSGYNQLQPKAKLAGCWAHARRYFTEVLDALPKDADRAGSLAVDAINRIAELYRVESKLKEAWGENLASDALSAILAARQEKSAAICDAYFQFCKTNKNRSTGKLRDAMEYSLNEEQKLRHYLSDPVCEIDNNRAERSVKPFVMGRKAWLFSNTQRGARGSAMLYSLVITAKENKLKIYDYLVYLFKRIPAGGFSDVSDWVNLMPWSSSLPSELRVKS
jgi:transposase